MEGMKGSFSWQVVRLVKGIATSSARNWFNLALKCEGLVTSLSFASDGFFDGFWFP